VLAVAYHILRPIPRLASAVRELSEGRLDTRVSGVNTRDELGDLAAAFNKMVDDLQRHVAAIAAATASRERVEGELRIARDIQLSLLPSTFPAFPERPEFDLHATNAAARSIAGDFFDFELVSEDELYFVIADVSGKGVPAAMFMAVTRTLLRNLNRAGLSPGEIITAVNRLLVRENRRMMFVTLFLGFYNLRTGHVRYVNAGHPLPRLIGPGGLRNFGTDNGALVGVMDGETWTNGEETIAPGETLVLYTDGITEAGMGDLPIYGEARMDEVLKGLVGASARSAADAIVSDVTRYQGDQPTDDVTVVVLRRML
jgi:sigma-B regulation protein RsbU (phosphoserine phosphatase)